MRFRRAGRGRHGKVSITEGGARGVRSLSVAGSHGAAGVSFSRHQRGRAGGGRQHHSHMPLFSYHHPSHNISMWGSSVAQF
eukprot:8558240-Pyramimonas_sp.AAC.1